MTKAINDMTAGETDLVCGAVTEGPNGEGCTEPRLPTKGGFPTLQGGPAQVDINDLF
jgi:hypothetical protein